MPQTTSVAGRLWLPRCHSLVCLCMYVSYVHTLVICGCLGVTRLVCLCMYVYTYTHLLLVAASVSLALYVCVCMYVHTCCLWLPRCHSPCMSVYVCMYTHLLLVAASVSLALYVCVCMYVSMGASYQPARARGQGARPRGRAG